jgi:hypothetical protein
MPDSGSGRIVTSCGWFGGPSVKPVVPLVQFHQLVLYLVSAVLSDHFIDSASESFWVVVGKPLLVVQKQTCVVLLFVQLFEVLRVVILPAITSWNISTPRGVENLHVIIAGSISHENCLVLAAPFEEFGIARVFSELIFGLVYLVATFSQDSLKDTTDVFVEKECSSRHLTVSFGFNEDSRTDSNARSLSCSNSRISSIWE